MVHIVKSRTRREIWEAESAAPQRPNGMTGGSWIADMVALVKMITLCNKCAHKFDYRRAGYRPETLVGYSWCFATCDDCRDPFVRCSIFVRDDNRED